MVVFIELFTFSLLESCWAEPLNDVEKKTNKKTDPEDVFALWFGSIIETLVV